MTKGSKLKPIIVTQRQRTILERMQRTRSSDAGLVLRIKIVLGGADKMSNSDVVRQHEVGHEAVRRWRTRWESYRERFEEIESNPAVADESERIRDLETAIREALSDEHRSGAPAKFSAEQQVKIIAVACEDLTVAGLDAEAAAVGLARLMRREVAVDEDEDHPVCSAFSTPGATGGGEHPADGHICGQGAVLGTVKGIAG